jgi:hypothetical protein
LYSFFAPQGVGSLYLFFGSWHRGSWFFVFGNLASWFFSTDVTYSIVARFKQVEPYQPKH